ncbi:hypothetical protein [Salinibacillus xinjiangensis]|uniref:Uncharacterized protein n=1 Tax=Salinibacillus xinjiangensis TaxID=1229268 RepID=A0A6G1X308_9BACI|nr:hypothetical protein [Salinibacillus xinjiangensis]MRG85373.1 hypothetical protein [Salinibacillus xinjiangensis]
MSWKAVEMQVALPRTQDLGQIQNQLEQRGSTVQNYLAQARLKEDERRRKQVNETKQIEHQRLQNPHQEKNMQLKQPQTQSQIKKQIINQQQRHPFLGQRIDYNS